MFKIILVINENIMKSMSLNISHGKAVTELNLKKNFQSFIPTALKCNSSKKYLIFILNINSYFNLFI